MDEVYARSHELAILKRLYSSNQSEFLAIYGRRRIGKTFMIRKFFKKKGTYFELTGIKDGLMKNQLKSFAIEFERTFGISLSAEKYSSWFEAFNQLRIAIEKHKSKGKIILFFDELPWLATPRSEFLNIIDHCWNRYLSDDNRIILIVCGSAASWMIKKVIQNKGGLHGRLTATIRLLPFTIDEVEQFLLNKKIAINRIQLIEIYMAIGGVAKYLTYIQKGQSALQIISQLCFNGPLFKEFDELYSSLFTNHTRHITIIKALASKPSGLNKNELCHLTHFTSGGGINTILEELEASGFVAAMSHFGKTKKNLHYRLIDEYSLFYLKWITLAKSSNFKLVDSDFWLKMRHSPAGRSWSGFAFENLCMKNILKIKGVLGISGVLSYESSWFYKPESNSNERGVQIDLIIDRDDNCINLCEIKYSTDEFLISKDYAKILLTKKNVFIEKTKTKKRIFLTLITTFGVKNNSIKNDIVDIEITLNDLF